MSKPWGDEIRRVQRVWHRRLVEMSKPNSPRPRRDRVVHSHDDEILDVERSAMDQEERDLAEEKVQFLVEAGRKGLITVLLLIFLPPVGVVFGILWAIKFGREFFQFVVEPRVRERVLGERADNEIGERVRRGIEADRRVLTDEHSHSLETLSASIAHEIRNPITAAKSLVQQMQEDPVAADNPEYARVALSELERVERSISHLLRYARDEDMRMDELRMADVLDSALESFRDRAQRSKTEVVREFDCEGLMRGDAEKLRRVVINLLGNAFDALAEASHEEPRLDVSLGENLAGTEVWVRIRDNGAGMDSETRAKALAPFVTSKSTGTGLGLAIVKKIVDSHHGTIELESELGRGTEFVLTFPKVRGNGAPGSEPRSRSGGGGGAA